MPGTVKTELNAVDRFVKQRLLNHSSLFGSRLEVLQYVFFVGGNGSFWNADGTLGSRSPEPTGTKMNYFDLDGAPGVIDEAIAKLMISSQEEISVRRKRERAIRALIAEDIDVYAQCNVMQDTVHVDTIQAWDIEDSLAAEAPFEVLNHDWAKALMEVLQAACQSLRSHLRMQHEDFSRDKANPLLLDKHDQINTLIGKVSNVPGLYNKSAIKAMMDML
jgi:hypothetical protein